MDRPAAVERPRLLSVDAAHVDVREAHIARLQWSESEESARSMPARFSAPESCIGRYVECFGNDEDADRID